MSHCESESVISSNSEDSDVDSTDTSVESTEVKEPSTFQPESSCDNSGYENYSCGIIPYAYEPLADEAWTKEYNRQIKAEEELELKLQNRLRGTTVNTWCKCGNCSLAFLENFSECHCCAELEGCGEALKSDQVTEDVGPNVTLKCIIEHPGFAAVCLEKWNLRVAADHHFKAKEIRRYQRSGSEIGFLHIIAYRQYSRLVSGFFSTDKKLTIPACVYTAIRKKFNTSQEGFSPGFQGPSTES